MRSLIIAASLFAWPAFAQAPAPGPAPVPAAAPAAPGADSPATTAFKQASEHMMGAMDVPYTGDADRDFVNGMMPHHLGAIDMAHIEAQYGHDPELKQLAHDIIVSQNKEVVFMRRWLLQHPKKN